MCVCVIYICTPGGKTAPIGAKDLVESLFFFFYQVNEISSNIQRYGLFPWLFPLIFFLSDISFCYYNILSSVVMYISKLSAIYRHWGHGTERERTSGGQWFRFVLLSNNISNGHQKKTTDPTPSPRKKKMDKNGRRFNNKKFRFDVGNCVPSSVMVKCDGQSDHHQSTTRVKVRSTHALTIYHCMVVHYNSHSLSLSLFYSCYNNQIERREYKETIAPFSYTFHGVPIYIYFFFIIIIIIAAGPYIYTHTHTVCVCVSISFKRK